MFIDTILRVKGVRSSLTFLIRIKTHKSVYFLLPLLFPRIKSIHPGKGRLDGSRPNSLLECLIIAE